MPRNARRPRNFGEWKAKAGLTDAQIVAALKQDGVEVNAPSLICMIRAGQRNARYPLARGLAKLTGLPPEHFMDPAIVRAA